MAEKAGSEETKAADIRALLSTLEAPFEIFPLQAVAADLSAAVDRSEDFLAESAGPWGVSPKYRSVEDEHHIDKIGLLIGSAFVLGQVAITQAIAILRRVRDLADRPAWLPKSRGDLMAVEARVHAETGFGRIALVDAVANYFKHHHEWPSDWVGAEDRHRRTIDMVRRLGLSPTSSKNLYTAVTNLRFSKAQMQALGTEIQDWRERLAEHVRRRLEPS